MTRLSRRRYLALVAGLGAGLTLACGPQASPLPPAAKPAAQSAPAPTQAAPAGGKRADILTATQLALPPSLLWGVPNGWSNLSKVDALTGDWLVMPDADGILVPRLAKEVPSLSNGGARFDGEGAARRLRVTYHLRDGLTWQDGTPLTSADVAFAFELQRTPDFPLIDRSLVGKVDEVKIPDAQTAEFVFKPGAFDPDFARVGEPYPKHLWSGIPPAQLLKSEHATKPVHAGPYRLKEFRPNEYALFEANPKYWAGPPKTPTVVMKVAADSNAMFAQAKAGQQEITMFGYTGADLLPELEKFAADGRHQVIVRPSTSTLIVGLNVDRPILSDVRVRRALLMALDRKGMNEAILHGRVGVLNSWMTAASPAYVPDLPAPTGGQDGAKALLKDGGWTPGSDGVLQKDGQRFEITFWGRTEDRQRELYMQAIARDWKAIGVNATITLQPTDLVFGKKGAGVISRRDFDAIVWQVSTMDAAGGYTMLHSSQIPSQANGMTGENYFGWKNPRADELLAKARSTPSDDERLAAYREHQKLFMEDLPALPLFSHDLIHLVRSSVKGYRPTSSVRVADTWNAFEWESAQ
ncbi:MAG: peptide ABC transporter substrate-binding protein [Chloroflexota bacterium]